MWSALFNFSSTAFYLAPPIVGLLVLNILPVASKRNIPVLIITCLAARIHRFHSVVTETARMFVCLQGFEMPLSFGQRPI